MVNYIRRNKLFILFILFLIIIVLYLLLNSKNNVTASNDIVIDKNDEKIEKNKSDLDEEEIIVEIKGAVNLPGVYTLKLGSRVNDLVILAGGFLENASTEYINLSKKLVDEMVVKVYTNDEIEKSNRVEVVTKYVEKECNCPNINNDACINNLSSLNDTTTSDSSVNNYNEVVNNGLVNINSATKDQLVNIPGIGEAKAVKIIEYRDNNGKFNNIEDIMNVSGIGSSMYDKIKDYIEV